MAESVAEKRSSRRRFAQARNDISKWILLQEVTARAGGHHGGYEDRVVVH